MTELPASGRVCLLEPPKPSLDPSFGPGTAEMGRGAPDWYFPTVGKGSSCERGQGASTGRKEGIPTGNEGGTAAQGGEEAVTLAVH